MGSKTLGKVQEEIAEKYAEEADELGLSRSDYIRRCVEIGRLTFRSTGKVDIDRLRELTEKESVSTDSDLETSEGDLTDAVLRNLSTDKDRSLTPEELREMIFGTEEEQREQIKNTVQQLSEAGMVEVRVGDEYIKTEDYDE